MMLKLRMSYKKRFLEGRHFPRGAAIVVAYFVLLVPWAVFPSASTWWVICLVALTLALVQRYFKRQNPALHG